MPKKVEEQIARYEVISQQDKNNDDILIPLPPELLIKMGWKEGDDINITIDEFGRYVFYK